jgi:hypothetical protein
MKLRVLRVERERGLQGQTAVRKSPERSGEPKVVVRPRVTRVPEGREPEIARGLRVALLLVGGDALGDVVLGDGVAGRQRGRHGEIEVVDLPALGMGQHVDGLGQLLEPQFRLAATRSRRPVRVGFPCQESEPLTNLRFCRFPAHAQERVVVDVSGHFLRTRSGFERWA